jgi:phosphoglycerate dehydrogenase-like enzyme
MNNGTQKSPRPQVVILDDYERSAKRMADWTQINAKADVRIYEHPLRGQALVDATESAHVLVIVRDRTPVTKVLLDQLPHLKYLIFTGARNGLLDTAALAERAIPVSHTEFGPSKDATAELTIALLMAAMKRFDLVLQTAGQLGADSWRPAGGSGANASEFIMPRLLSGAVLGLIGLGAIGSKVALVAKALGMQVKAWSPNMTSERASSHGVEYASLDTLLATSDAVSLHLVLAASTRHIINQQRLSLMKSSAVLVNTSRSGLVDEQALAQALMLGQIAAAAVDVFDVEPVPPGYPLTQAPNLISTPHLGFVCQPVYEKFWAGVTQGLSAWLDGQPLPRPYA